MEILESVLGENIARESARAVDRFGRYSDAQLRSLQSLFIDARVNIQGQIADKFPTSLTGDIADLPAGAARLRRLDMAIAVEMETLKAQVNKEIPQMIGGAGNMGVTRGQTELASVMKTFPDIRPSWTLVNMDAIRVYSDYALQLSDDYIDEARRQIQAALRQGLIEQKTVGQLTTQIRQYIGAEFRKPNKALTYKAQRIARTEMARAYAGGHTAYGKSNDWVIGERWHFSYMGPWPCAQCESVAVENEDFYYKDGGPPNIPVHPQSYSEDTEVYTDNGWMFFKNLKNDEQILSLNPDTFDLEWLPSLGKIAYHFTGQIYYLRNKHLSLKVTPGHQQLFGIRKNKKEIDWQIDSVENMVNKYPEFIVPINESVSVQVYKENISLIDYDGMVYDVTLPKNHILWVRQNGKTCFSGNCRCYTTYLYRENLFTKEEIDKFKIPVAGEGITPPRVDQSVRILDVLRNGAIRKTDDIGIGITNPQYIKFSNTPIEAIGKTRYIKGEIASYRISSKFGGTVIPETTGRSIGKVEYSMQRWIKNAKTADLVPTQAWETVQKGKTYKEMQIWDYLFGQSDRHASNWMVAGKNRVWAIDNGFTFNAGNYAREAGLIQDLSLAKRGLPEGFLNNIAKIAKTKADDLVKISGNNITQMEANELIRRATAVARKGGVDI